MGRGNGKSQEEVEFIHDEPATFPHRTYSGRAVNPRVIKAMYQQHELFKECSQSADKLLATIKGVVRRDSMPPRFHSVGGQS